MRPTCPRQGGTGRWPRRTGRRRSSAPTRPAATTRPRRPSRFSSCCTGPVPPPSGRSGSSRATSSRWPARAAGSPAGRRSLVARRRRVRHPGRRHAARGAAGDGRGRRPPRGRRTGRRDRVRLAGQDRHQLHHRRRPDAFGAELADAARASTIPDGARVWVACEAAAMRDIRRYFIAERQLPPSSLVTRGYWRTGEREPPRPRLRRGLAHPVSYCPTRPSIRSRRKSAWPQCRAYSSIIWISISRRVLCSPSPQGAPRTQIAGRDDEVFGKSDLRRASGPGVRDYRRVAYGAVQVAVVVVGEVGGGTSSPDITRRNQCRSTSAMCRIRPSSDMVDGATERRASCSPSRSGHFISRV